MNGDPLVRAWTGPARRRQAAITWLAGTPVALIASALVLRLAGVAAAAAVLLLAIPLLAFLASRRADRLDQGWLVRQLDGTRDDLEDSSGLLFADAATLGPLQRLQRSRLEARVAASPPPDMRPALPKRALMLIWLTGLGGMVAVLIVPHRHPADALAPYTDTTPLPLGVSRLVGQRLRVVPPGYTGLPARDLDRLDAKAPQGSRLIWTLAFMPKPQAAVLAMLGGSALPLSRHGDQWTGGMTLGGSILYRVVPTGAPDDTALHRIEAIPDQPPAVTASNPSRTLSIASAGQRRWTLLFDANDDYGVAPQAELTLTVAAGEGENIAFHDHRLNVRGSGDPRHRRFAVSLDLAALGFDKPGDLVAQLRVRDMRAPAPQAARSPSLILRRLPMVASEGTGVDGALRATLPAYLRSQRQVIIDALALLRDRRTLPPERFRRRSIAIGDDQQALRLRYGQFLGGETEAHDTELPTSDAPLATLGKEDDVLGDYGHKHDEGEAVTLFDPETRGRLTQAVDQMWQSEGALRGGDPARALPFANRALVLIKQVQQATRVFLAKVGSALPPIDETRRLTGKRDDIIPMDAGLPALPADPRAAAAWAAIDGTPGGVRDLTPLTRWLRGNGQRVADPLAVAAALDAVRRNPGCADCLGRLRVLVWPALARPPAGVVRRDGGGAIGARYLDALRGGGGR